MSAAEILRGRMPDLLCFSHLRWHSVFQRPQHLLTRYARQRRVFVFEEPLREERREASLEVSRVAPNLEIAVPRLPLGLSTESEHALLRGLLDRLVREQHLENAWHLYLTPMALPFSRHLPARLVVYDCMDELSTFKGAEAALPRLEAQLFERAHVVFTGGWSLYEWKRDRHPNVHGFPSSVDVAHFARARTLGAEAADQAHLPRPRIGFCGVIDERMNLELVAKVAAARPEWQLVMIGPVVKIDPAELPRRDNLHYLGSRPYAELPSYLAGWDVAILPFARNDATRFISPTKTPEYLAAGRPVVSTSIRDVVRPYGEQSLVRIADDVDGFVRAIERAKDEDASSREWLTRVDELLGQMSWDLTFARMQRVLEEAAAARDEEAALTSVTRRTTILGERDGERTRQVGVRPGGASGV